MFYKYWLGPGFVCLSDALTTLGVLPQFDARY